MPVGETISEDVIEQIKAREDLFSSDDRNPDQLRYLSSRNAWVRVISFVNKGRSAELSKNFVLSGVASSYTGNSFTQYTGIDFNLGSNSNSFYNTTQTFGTRPRPGITSFSLKSKNSEGTVQLAEIGFVVWNEDDLDTIEQLYLRLGFEVMVEWGHTLYIDNKGDYREYNDDLSYSDFFENSVDESTVNSHIKKNREDTNYNADGFLGYITNFSWSFRQDGGYDCSIKVISAGAVIESLLGNVGSSDRSEILVSDSYTSDFNSLYNISKALLITSASRTIEVESRDPATPQYDIPTNRTITTIEERDDRFLAFNDTVPTVPPVKTLNLLSGNIIEGVNIPELPGAGEAIYETDPGKTLLNELAAEFDYFKGENGKFRPFAFGLVINSGESSEEYESTSDFNLDPIFMPLRYCLALVNSMIKRQSGDRAVVFDLKSPEKFLVSKNLIVTKPLKTFLLTKPDQSDPIKKYLYLRDAYVFASDIAYGLARSRPGREGRDAWNNAGEEILNIFVNLEVFARNINALRESDPEDNTTDMFTLLRNILDEINQSVGYGIDLTVIHDAEIGKYKIIDRGKLPGRSDPVPQEIKISGTSTTVSSLSLTSKVTNKLGNQISIAAQTEPSSYPASVIKYREWNRDLTSRLRRIPPSGITPNSSETVTKNQVFVYFVRLWNEYQILNNTDNINNNNKRIYNSDEWDSFGSRGQIVTRVGIDYDPELPKGLIPIELSFTMDGIAGLKNLQSFTIPKKLLPEKYDNEYVGFIINGLEHTIENNRWYTQVRAQMYLFRPPPGTEDIGAIEPIPSLGIDWRAQ